MDYEEEVLDNTEETEDSLPEDIAEEPEDPGESLDSLTEEEGQQETDQPDEQGTKAPKEPGYVRNRISKAVQKAVAEVEERLRAQYAPIQERLLEMDAQELVRTHKVADLETAKELLRYRQGMTATQPEQSEQPQPRQNNGQFAPKQDPATAKHIDMLSHQADVIKERRGIDVIKVFNENQEIREKVVAGEMDFYDVAEQMSQPKKKPPAPMRSPNGASGTNPNAIDSMSDAQFERMEKRIKEGARYSLK